MNGATALAVTYAGHMPRSAYERSKSVETIAWQEHPLARSLALRLLQESSGESRQAIGQALLDVLDDAAGLPPCKLTVADRPQRHRKREGRLGAVDDVVPPGPSSLRPGGTDPPTWIRDQIAALFGRKEP